MTLANITRRFSYATVLAVLVLLALSLSTPALAQKNLVYIDANITSTGQNAVIALQNDGTGKLTPLVGSPFLTGGTGVGPSTSGDAQWDSSQEVVINKAGTLLFAVNGHSNNISAFNINSDGTLTAVTGSPFASGGQQPASIGWLDNALGSGNSLMVVVNKNSDSLQTGGVPNYTTFTANSAGVLTMNAGSTLNLPSGASPAQALVRPKGGANFFGIEFMNKTVSAYKLNRFGLITLVNTSTPPGSTPVVVGAVAHPVVKGFYVGLPAQAQVAVYNYSTTASMTFLREVANTGMAVCWLTTNSLGTRLYSSETASGTESVYDLTNTKNPVQLQHIAVSGTGALPTHNAVDPTGQFLYVLDRNGLLHVFNISATDGTITENLAPFNLGLPSGTVPLGVAVLSK